MSNTIINQQAPLVNPPAPPRGFHFGDRVRITARGFFHGQRGTVRNGFVAGGIQSYYVMLAGGIIAFDTDEMEREAKP